MLAPRQARDALDKTSTCYRGERSGADRYEEGPEPTWLAEVWTAAVAAGVAVPVRRVPGVLRQACPLPAVHVPARQAGRDLRRSAFRWEDGHLRLATTGTPLRIVWTWPGLDPVTLDPCMVSVSRDPAGGWFVVLHVDMANPDVLPTTGQVVGVDLDLLGFLVLSHGERIAHPGHMDSR